MIKLKKIADNKFVAQHELTGEPIALVRKHGSGGHVEWHAEWHPHVKDMHPELEDLLHTLTTSKTSDEAKYSIGASFQDLSKPMPIRTEVEHRVPTDKDGEFKDHVHFIDNETGKKIISATTPNAKGWAQGKMGWLKGQVSAIHQGTKEGLDIAAKSANIVRDRYNPKEMALGHMARLAQEHLKTLSGEGPRFIGHRELESSSKHHTYKTSIENPAAAVSEYIKSAIPGHENMTNLTPAHNITMLQDGTKATHIIQHTPGTITHTTINHSDSAYGSKPLDRVYEDWAGLDRNPSHADRIANDRLSNIYKKTLTQPMSDYIDTIDKRGVYGNQYDKVKDILRKQNDDSPENKSSLERAKKFIKKAKFDRANT